MVGRIDTTEKGLRKIFELNDGFTAQEGYVSTMIKDGQSVKGLDENRYYSVKDGQLIRRSVACDSSYDETVICDRREATTFIVSHFNKLKFE